MENSQATEFPSKKTRTIAIYTASLQGFHLGELVNQIRQLCFVKGYRLAIFHAQEDGKFNCDLQLDALDGAILLHHATTNDFAEALLTRGIPCVSVSYDYFPLNIPVVSSDNEHGIRLAFEQLLAQGHRKIAYIGDLSQYNPRKRYEYYCEALDQHNLPSSEDWVIDANNTEISGGCYAALQYRQRQCDTTAIIFGSGMTAIGFIHQFKKKQGRDAPPLFITFDALSLLPVITPEVISVDQNLNLIAYRALNIIENQILQKTPQSQTLVPPKITRISDTPSNDYDAFIATCIDLPAFHNANYTKSLLINSYAWPRDIAQNQLDSIMSLSPLFEKFMSCLFLSRYFTDSNGLCWVKHIKSFLSDRIENTDMSDSRSLCRANLFPPTSIADHLGKHNDLVIHFPITVRDKTWGFLSCFGHSAAKAPMSSFLAFAGYMESVIALYEKQLLKTTPNGYENAVSKNTVTPYLHLHLDTDAVIDWNIGSNETVWSEKALEKLGFQSAVEQNIYRHMDITDRIHPQYFDAVRHQVNECRQTPEPFQIQTRFKIKGGHYHDALLAASPQRDSGGKLLGIQFYLGVSDTVSNDNP